MGDCQLVLRYFALKDPDNIRGSMKSMLDRAMAKDLADADVEPLKAEYRDRFQFLYDVFGGRPFALSADEKGSRRISAAIYDASMVAANELWTHRDAILADAVSVRTRMKATLENDEKLTILTGSGNTANSVRERIALMKTILLPA